MEKEKKLQIIKAAAKRFDKHGLNKTTLNEVARDLRIGKATIYHYFESKDDLYFSVLEWEGTLLLEEINNILNNAEASPAKKIFEYLSSKENIQLKYKLIYDTVVHLLNDSAMEPEVKFFSNLNSKEEEILSQFLNASLKNKNENSSAAVSLLIEESWNFFLAGKINIAGSLEKFYASKEHLIKLLEEKFI